MLGLYGLKDGPITNDILTHINCCWMSETIILDIFTSSNYFNSFPTFSHLFTYFESLYMSRDFQQCGILTSVDSGEPVQPPFKLRISK